MDTVFWIQHILNCLSDFLYSLVSATNNIMFKIKVCGVLGSSARDDNLTDSLQFGYDAVRFQLYKEHLMVNRSMSHRQSRLWEHDYTSPRVWPGIKIWLISALLCFAYIPNSLHYTHSSLPSLMAFPFPLLPFPQSLHFPCLYPFPHSLHSLSFLHIALPLPSISLPFFPLPLLFLLYIPLPIPRRLFPFPPPFNSLFLLSPPPIPSPLSIFLRSFPTLSPPSHPQVSGNKILLQWMKCEATLSMRNKLLDIIPSSYYQRCWQL